jgi:hypothetical protein
LICTKPEQNLYNVCTRFHKQLKIKQLENCLKKLLQSNDYTQICIASKIVLVMTNPQPLEAGAIGAGSSMVKALLGAKYG